MRKWAVYILLAVCLSGCGRGNGNKQGSFSNNAIADSIPTEAIRLNIQGNVLFNKGDYNTAMECYTKAIEIYPKYDTAFYNLGNISSKLGDNKESSELGCLQANTLLPLCGEYIKERTDSLQRQNEGKEKSE